MIKPGYHISQTVGDQCQQGTCDACNVSSSVLMYCRQSANIVPKFKLLLLLFLSGDRS